MNVYFLVIIITRNVLCIDESNTSISIDSIFWNNYTSLDLLSTISKLEKKLKIFIYPVPEEANRFINKTEDLDSSIALHYKAEYIFRDFLKQSSYLTVSNPSDANVFLIDHDWSRLHANGKCNIIYTDYLPIIINNIVDNYPYYNRSGGIDHYFFAMYDLGPFCDTFCEPNTDTSIFKRIENVVYIGNYGMDKKHFSNHKYNNPVSNECHRAGYDIVIPQLLKNITLKFHNIFYNNMYPYRKYDSTFAGRTWGERKILNELCNQSSFDYITKNTENLQCFLYGQHGNHYLFGHTDLLFKGYFSYNACNVACWSQRLYESMASYTIPIIITDGGIQAFEKFIDWSKFTVKMSLSTWFNETLRNKYRQNIRYESEIYRNITINCLNKFNSNNNIKWYNILNYFKINKKYEMKEYNFLDINCPELKNTLIYNKIKYYHQFIEWIDFNNLYKSINTWKLLELEIYCRIRNINKFNESNIFINLNELCSKPSDYTSNLEYFY